MHQRSHIKNQLKRQNKRQNHIKRYEKAFNKYDSQEMIKDALDYMKEQGYDFAYSTQSKLPKKHKQMLRHVYLRFNCDHCTKKLGKIKRWTSTKGTVGIKFQFTKQTNPQFFSDLLIFKFRIYRMQCKECGNYGEPQIYDSQLQRIEKQFCEIVANILNGIKPKWKKRNKKQIDVPDLKNHRQELCQACKLGKCSMRFAENVNSEDSQIQD